MEFDQHLAFTRNLGWITKAEQEVLFTKKVAIAGLGGVGGHHALNLARHGIRRFHLADFDKFEIKNFNRQAGADITTIDKNKLDVMAQKILEINPTAEITYFKQGVTPENISEFLKDVDSYVDGLDVFVLTLRQMIFKKCYEMGIPATTVGPMGMGAALLNFLPGHMSFEDYFGLGNKSEIEKVYNFIVGVTPSFLHAKSLIDPSYFNLEKKMTASMSSGCYLSAGVMGTEVVKILLNRKPVLAAPYGLHFDAYSYRYKKTWLPGGYKNPFYQFKLKLLKRLLKKK